MTNASPMDPQELEAREVETLEELAALDSDEMVRGYNCGYEAGRPPEGASRSFMHGYLNGQADRGRFAITPAQRKLAHLWVNRGGKHGNT